MTTYVEINGNTYSDGTSDEGSGIKYLDNGGHWDNFIPMLQDTMTRVSESENYALNAVNSPGTSATSTSSVTVGTGSKSFTIQTGKSIVDGMWMVAVDNAAPSTNMIVGVVTSYDSGTGALVLDGQVSTGSGTIADWTISLTAAGTGFVSLLSGTQAEFNAACTDNDFVFPDSNNNVSFNNVSLDFTTTATAAGTTTLTVASEYHQYFTGSTSQTVVMPVVSTLTQGHSYQINNNSTDDITIQSSGTNEIGVILPGSAALLTCLATTGTDETVWDMCYVTTDEIPQLSKSEAYTLVMADKGKHLLHPTADSTPRTFTIPSNASVPYTIGTCLTFVNQSGAGDLSIAITSDTMRLANAGTTGTRTLSQNGIATAIKVTSTEWLISGIGLL